MSVVTHWKSDTNDTLSGKELQALAKLDTDSLRAEINDMTVSQ